MFFGFIEFVFNVVLMLSPWLLAGFCMMKLCAEFEQFKERLRLVEKANHNPPREL